MKITLLPKQSNKKTNGLLFKLITSYSVFLFIILILFTYLYYSSKSNAENSYNLQSETLMAGRAESFEDDLKVMDTNCRQLLQNNSFRYIMNEEDSFPEFIQNGHDLSNELAVNIYSDSLLPTKEVYYYLRTSQYMLGNGYFLTGSRFYDWIKKYPSALKNAWFEFLCTEEYYNTFLPLEYFQSKSGDKYYLYLMDLGNLCYLDCDVTAVFVIDRSEFNKMMGIEAGNKNSYISIYDPEKEKFILEISYLENDLSEVINDFNFKNNFLNYSDSECSFTLGKYVSENTGYIYYYSFEPFIVNSDQIFSNVIFSGLLILVLLVGAVFIFIFINANMKPVVQMGEELKNTSLEKEKLQSILDNQTPIIRRSYVRQLMLTGVRSEEEASYIKNYLGLTEDRLYKAMYLLIQDADKAGTSVNEASEKFINEEIYEAVIKKLSEGLNEPVLFFYPDKYSIGVLLSRNDDGSSNYLLKVQNAVLNIHNDLLSGYNLWLLAGIGKTTHTVMNIWESYEQAVEATSYSTNNYIFLPYEYIKKDSKAFYYPQEFSNKLIHFVTSGNKASALELLRLVRKENLEERSLSGSLLHFLLTDIRNSLLKARFELPTSTSEEKLTHIDERFNEKISFDLLENITRELTDLFAEKSQDNNLIDTIIKYIKENYSDSLLCLTKISDEFKISETYFSHLFKEKTGVNFSNYLENIRMKKALELIKSKDVPLTEVYMMVGYNNQNSFRRAFKKIYGTTPGSIREY